MKKIFLPAVFFVFAVMFFDAGNAYTDEQTPAADIKVGKIVKAEVKDRKIIITNDKGRQIDYRIKGICYAPDIDGGTFCKNFKKDIPLIKKAGANSIRTYRPLGCYKDEYGNSFNSAGTKKILDKCLEYGLTVAVGFSYEDMAEDGLMYSYLKEFGNHPAILMVAFGNEYNYHYNEWFSKEEWFQRLKKASTRVKKYLPGKIVAAVHGEMPSAQEVKEYTRAGMDLIMMNMYRGSNFGFASQRWHEMSKNMPWVLGEFGRSSKDGSGHDTSKLQVSYLQTLIRNMEHGYLFSFSDDPAKGEGEISPVIGSEGNMGIYEYGRYPKKAVKAVKEEYGKIPGSTDLN
jgi:hypothetical protein